LTDGPERPLPAELRRPQPRPPIQLDGAELGLLDGTLDGTELGSWDCTLDGAELGSGSRRKSSTATATAAQAASSPSSSILVLPFPDNEAAAGLPVTPTLMIELGHAQTLISINEPVTLMLSPGARIIPAWMSRVETLSGQNSLEPSGSPLYCWKRVSGTTPSLAPGAGNLPFPSFRVVFRLFPWPLFLLPVGDAVDVGSADGTADGLAVGPVKGANDGSFTSVFEIV
jgi:hypothetical protein